MRQTYSSSRAQKRGFTLVELLVVIAIIGTLVALLLPAVQAARESGRRATCTNNQKNLALAMMNYDSAAKQLPGYVNDLQNPRNPGLARQGSWVVMIFPYIEQNALWDNWSTLNTSNPVLASPANIPELELLICPSNPSEVPGLPINAYVANSGNLSPGNSQNAANGVFFDVSVNPAASPQRDGRENTPPPRVSIDYIQSNDGTTNTVMFSETLYSRFWTYADNSGNPTPNSFSKASMMADDPRWFGFGWSNASSGADVQYFTINGLPDSEPRAVVQDMRFIENVHAFPASNHPGGVVAAFCDGRVLFLNETVSPQVYGQLMTSNSRRSNFEFGGTLDRNLPPVSDDEF